MRDNFSPHTQKQCIKIDSLGQGNKEFRMAKQKKAPSKKDIKNKHNQTRKKAMVKALEKSLGIVTIAAKTIDLERCTHYQWIKEDPEYAEAVAGISEMAIDFAESKLHKQITDGVPSSTMFYLKCKGKHRGYVERQEITGADGDAIKINSQLGALGAMSEDQIKSILKDD